MVKVTAEEEKTDLKKPKRQNRLKQAIFNALSETYVKLGDITLDFLDPDVTFIIRITVTADSEHSVEAQKQAIQSSRLMGMGVMTASTALGLSVTKFDIHASTHYTSPPAPPGSPSFHVIVHGHVGSRNDGGFGVTIATLAALIVLAGVIYLIWQHGEDMKVSGSPGAKRLPAEVSCTRDLDRDFASGVRDGKTTEHFEFDRQDSGGVEAKIKSVANPFFSAPPPPPPPPPAPGSGAFGYTGGASNLSRTGASGSTQNYAATRPPLRSERI